MSDHRCGSTETTTGEPCGFPVPRHRCPFHGDGEPPDNGRPTEYSERRAAHICEEIAGGRALKAICREDDDMPSASAVLHWVKDDRRGFADRYARACHIRLHVLGEELLEISDDGRNDTYVDSEGNRRVDYDVIQRSKLRVDTRKWMLSRLMPQKYGKTSKLEHSGPGGGPIQHEVGEMSDDELVERAEQLKNRLAAIETNGDGGG